MSCGCKKVKKLQEIGEKEEETFLDITIRYLKKAALLLIGLCFSIILVPALVLIIIYKMTFGDITKPIPLPDFSKFRK